MTPKAVKPKLQSLVKKGYQKPKDIKPEHRLFILKVGEKLQAERKKRNLSTFQLEKEYRISRYLLSQLEKGKVYFTISSLLNVLDILDISPMDFFRDL